MSVKPGEKSGEKDIFKCLHTNSKIVNEEIYNENTNKDHMSLLKSLKKDDLIMIKMNGLKVHGKGVEYFGRFIEITGIKEDGTIIRGTVPTLKIQVVSNEHPFDMFSVSGGKETLFISGIESIEKITPKGDVLQNICSFLGGKKSNKINKTNKTNKRNKKNKRNKSNKNKY